MRFFVLAYSLLFCSCAYNFKSSTPPAKTKPPVLNTAVFDKKIDELEGNIQNVSSRVEKIKTMLDKL